MNLRQKGINWIIENLGAIHVSKMFPPDESATRDFAWWFQIPWAKLVSDRENRFVNLLCQKEVNGDEFCWLRVPAKHFTTHKSDFSFDGNGKLHLIVSASSVSRFREMRGLGKCDLSAFVQ